MKRRNLIVSVIVIIVILTGLLGLILCGKKDNKDLDPKNPKPLVEILYMNHGPVQPVLRELRSQLIQFENKTIIEWYDFEKDLNFKQKKGIDYHTPLVIWINNSNIIDVNGKQVKFNGFPKDQGPPFARGDWQINDLIIGIKKSIQED